MIGAAPGPVPAALKNNAPALNNKEAAELRNIESSIKAAEKKVELAAAALEDPAVATNAEELHRRQENLDEARAKLTVIFKRWEELETRTRGR